VGSGVGFGRMAAADVPEFYGFPPFFTLQPVLSTRERQLRLWQDFIISWHRSRSEQFLSVAEWPFFRNDAIHRSLKAEDRSAVAEYLVRNGYAEWEDDTHARLLIIWERPGDIAAKLYQFVRDQGLVDTVLTVYEITEGEQFEGSPFAGMDDTILRRAIALLEDEGKASLFQGNTSAEDGVKFF